ncbi:MAG: sigma-70 family RNA polymerase sigma factor [Myxococcaceae bacterium]
MKLATLTDEALLDAFRQGELAAFDVLYARYERPLFGFIVRAVGGDRAAAEDLLQQVFLSFLREAKRKQVERARALLFEVARNACANHRRSTGRADAHEAASFTDVTADPPDLELIRRQRSHQVQGALAKLSPQLNEVWSLRAAGLSYEEVASALSLPVGTVKSRLHEVVAQLKDAFAAQRGDES